MEQRAEQTETVKKNNTKNPAGTNEVSRDEIKCLLEVQTTLLQEFISDRKRQEEERRRKEEEQKKATYRNLMPDFCKWADLQKFNPNNVKQYKLQVISDDDEIVFLPKNINNPNEPARFKIVAKISGNVMAIELVKDYLEKKNQSDNSGIIMETVSARERVETVFLEKGDNPELRARETIKLVNRLYGHRDNFVLYL